MKNPCLFLALLSAILLLNASCKKELQQQMIDRPVSATIIIPSNPTLSGVLGTGHNVKDTIRLINRPSPFWRLNGWVFVDSADVLIIDPGTIIRGIPAISNVPGGGLVITRGAKILAEGTADNPIVFTSSAATPQSGDWGGVIILGNASSSHVTRVQVEGIPSNPPANATFGGTIGTNDADNSGILKYVRIEYAGNELSASNKSNGLTLAGVGSNTVIDYVNVFKAKDDAFQFFGGTVNASHLIAVDPLDELFETSKGYRGTIRYALGLADTTRADISHSNGIESLGDSIVTPFTNPSYKNLTIIGLPNQAKVARTNMPPSGTGRYGRAAHFGMNTSFDIDSAVFLGYNFSISLDSSLGNPPFYTNTTPVRYRANHATWLTHTVSHNYFSVGIPDSICSYITEKSGNTATGIGFSILTSGAFYNWAIADGSTAAGTTAFVGLTDPFNRGTVGNFMANPGSAAATVAGGGAFPGNVNWAGGIWARFQ